MRRRPNAGLAAREDEDGLKHEVILDSTEQEQIVNDLVEQANKLQQFWLPVIAGLCFLAAAVPPFLTPPPNVSKSLLLVMTVPWTVLAGAVLVKAAAAAAAPSSPSSSSLPLPRRDWLMLWPTLAAVIVFWRAGGLQDVRVVLDFAVWRWIVPAAVIGLSRQLDDSLQDGVTQATRMSSLLYNNPGA